MVPFKLDPQPTAVAIVTKLCHKRLASAKKAAQGDHYVGRYHAF